MAHKGLIVDGDGHFIIDPVTRSIVNESGKTTLIQFDHNSERLTFEVSPIVEGHEMSKCNRVEIHYINIATDKRSQVRGIYPVDDLKLEDNKLTLSWLISRNVTQLEGVVSFVVQFKCMDDGNEVYSWSTAVSDTLKVSKGIDNDGAIDENYSDLISQWYSMLVESSTGGVNIVEETTNNGLQELENRTSLLKNELEHKKDMCLADIPEDYTSLSLDKADGLKFTTDIAKNLKVIDSSNKKIDSLTIYGDSENAQNPTLKICGKNLIPYPYYQMNKETNGITFVVNEDGTVTANGTATAQAYIIISNKATLNLPYDTYCLSGVPLENNEDNKCYMNYAGYVQDGRKDGTIIDINESTAQNMMTCVVQAGKKVENFVFKPMLEVGTQATEFEIYKSPQIVDIPYVLGEGDTLTMSEGTVKTNIGGVETDITETETGQALLALHTNYPSSTFLCDTDIKVTYRADTTKAFENLKKAIIALGGSV